MTEKTIWEAARDYEHWKDDSQRGIICGFMGCIAKPSWKCPICGNYYCDRDKKIHLHSSLLRTDNKE